MNTLFSGGRRSLRRFAASRGSQRLFSSQSLGESEMGLKMFGAACVGTAMAGASFMQHRPAFSKSKDDEDTDEEYTELDPKQENMSDLESARLRRRMAQLKLFSGTANIPLAKEIAERLDTKLGTITVKTFADGEIGIQVHTNVRGKDVYIIQPTCPPGVNDNLMELILMISTMRRASANKITAVIPYYGYARQDRKMQSRVPISAADVARLLESMGVDRVVAVDLHCGQIQGFFGPRTPCDNLEAAVVALPYFSELLKDSEKAVVVSPDAGGVHRAKKFRDGLRARGLDTGLAMIIKQREQANSISSMDLVGDVEGADVVIVDDMIDTAGTLCKAGRELKARGAKRIYAFAAHGLFNGPAIDRIRNSDFEKVIVANSIQLQEKHKIPQIEQLSIASLLAEAISRIHYRKSVSELFNEQSSERKTS